MKILGYTYIKDFSEKINIKSWDLFYKKKLFWWIEYKIGGFMAFDKPWQGGIFLALNSFAGNLTGPSLEARPDIFRPARSFLLDLWTFYQSWNPYFCLRGGRKVVATCLSDFSCQSPSIRARQDLFHRGSRGGSGRRVGNKWRSS